MRSQASLQQSNDNCNKFIDKTLKNFTKNDFGKYLECTKASKIFDLV